MLRIRDVDLKLKRKIILCRFHSVEIFMKNKIFFPKQLSNIISVFGLKHKCYAIYTSIPNNRRVQVWHR